MHFSTCKFGVKIHLAFFFSIHQHCCNKLCQFGQSEAQLSNLVNKSACWENLSPSLVASVGLEGNLTNGYFLGNWACLLCTESELLLTPNTFVGIVLKQKTNCYIKTGPIHFWQFFICKWSSLYVFFKMVAISLFFYIKTTNFSSSYNNLTYTHSIWALLVHKFICKMSSGPSGPMFIFALIKVKRVVLLFFRFCHTWRRKWRNCRRREILCETSKAMYGT